MSSPAARIERNWYQFVALSGQKGQQWVQQYRESLCWDLALKTCEAVTLLRRSQVPAGRALLQEVESRLPQVRDLSISSFHVLERYFYPAQAYLQYCRDSYLLADSLLLRATEAVRAALEIEPFLLPMVDSCLDFGIQRIRIARALRQWPRMRQMVEEARRIVEEDEPLCVLRNGRSLRFSDLREFYDAIPLTEEEKDSLRDLLDPEVRTELFERALAGIYALPGLVIPYP
jgi:hypothetical protein